jgi:hypothetical protein
MALDKGFITGTELINMKLDPLCMLTKFLPSRAFILLTGLPHAGKTEFFMHQACEIALKGKVLFFCSEGGELNFQSRLKAYCKSADSLNNLIYIPRRWPNLTEHDGLIFLDTVVKQFNPITIIFDPGPEAFGEENDAAFLKAPLQKLYERIHDHYKLCLILSWHPAKNQIYPNVNMSRGSTAIPAKADMVFGLILQNKIKRILQLHKSRFELPDISYSQEWIIERIINDSGMDLVFSDKQKKFELDKEKRSLQLCEALSAFALEDEYTSTEIKNVLMKALKFSKSSSANYLNDLVKREVFMLIQPKIGNQPARYQYLGISEELTSI